MTIFNDVDAKINLINCITRLSLTARGVAAKKELMTIVSRIMAIETANNPVYNYNGNRTKPSERGHLHDRI